MPARGPLASWRTTDVLNLAASLLEASPLTLDRQVAAEVRVRALWIQRGRHDPGVSEARRLAIAAIEDAPAASPPVNLSAVTDEDDPTRIRILSVEVYSGWRVQVWRRLDDDRERFDATLARPSGTAVYSLQLWPSVEQVFESLSGYLARELGLPATHIAEALASTVEASS